MKTSVQLIEEILRAKMALHLMLVAQRNEGKTEIGGGSIDRLIEEVDAGLLHYERILVLYKNEAAAKVMEAQALSDDEADCD